MPAAVAFRPASAHTSISHLFEFGTDCIEVEETPPPQLRQHLESLGPNATMWCYRCERSFRLLAARPGGGGLTCAYADCDGAPLDFWSWSAYRVFVASAPLTPEPATRYSLAA